MRILLPRHAHDDAVTHVRSVHQLLSHPVQRGDATRARIGIAGASA